MKNRVSFVAARNTATIPVAMGCATMPGTLHFAGCRWWRDKLLCGQACGTDDARVVGRSEADRKKANVDEAADWPLGFCGGTKESGQKMQNREARMALCQMEVSCRLNLVDNDLDKTDRSGAAHTNGLASGTQKQTGGADGRFHKKTVNRIVYILVGNALYGLLLYFLVTWLAGYSLLLAYLGNLLFIFIVVAFDEFGIRKAMRPEAYYAEMEKLTSAKQKEKYLRFVRWALTNYMSFRTFLFVFYIAVVVFAQILKFYPWLAGESVTNFINIIEYSIIILLALKDFGEEFSRDKNRAQTRLEEFEQYVAEHAAPAGFSLWSLARASGFFRHFIQIHALVLYVWLGENPGFFLDIACGI